MLVVLGEVAQQDCLVLVALAVTGADITLVAHVLQMAIVNNHFARDHVDFVADAIKVATVFLEDMGHGGLEAAVGVGPLEREPVSGVSLGRQLDGFEAKLIAVVGGLSQRRFAASAPLG